MKILLIFPPQWDPFIPYLSLPHLKAYLESKGYEVKQRDLNIESYHLLLEKDILRHSLEKVRDDLKDLESRDKLDQKELAQYRILFKAETSGSYIIDKIDEARRIYTGSEYYSDPAALLKSHWLIEAALDLTSAAYYPSQFSLYKYGVGTGSTSSEDLIKVVHDGKVNLFREMFRKYFLPSILDEKPGIIGFSVVGCYQIIPALTLASLIKEQDSDIHICMGGHTFSRWADVLPQKNNLFSLFDSVIVQEGEIPLLKLARAVEKNGTLDSVPNLIYRDDGKIRVNPVEPMEDVDAVPTPDFDGLPLETYFLPELVLPIYTSRGCYHRKCAFCDHKYGYENYFKTRDLERVVEDVRKLSQLYKTNLFQFSDEINPPARFKKLFEKLDHADLQIKWLHAMRFEKEHDPEFCRFLSEHGAAVFIWGFESACQRVVDKMGKEYDVERNKKILRNCAEAGIYNYVAVVHGFSGAQKHEEEETLEFITNNTDIVDGLFPNVFYLAKWTTAANEPDRYGLKVLKENATDLDLGFGYIPDSGITFFEALEWSGYFLNEVKKVDPSFDFWNTLAWPQVFLYVLKYGREKVKQISTKIKPPPEPGDWGNVKVGLCDGVFQKCGLYDISRKSEEKGKYEFIYDLPGGKVFQLKPDSKEVMDLFALGNNVREVAAKLSNTRELPVEEVTAKVIGLVKMLGKKNIVIYKVQE